MTLGYHGKGFYSGQGVYVYSNNGEHGSKAKADPTIPSGVLAEWDGKADSWTIVRRNQFTEVTGPGGIHGSSDPASDPIWAVGWDDKSIILGIRMPETGWTFYRLPKGSHSYDGAHGWNTEWPRIREVGEEDLLMTMHGTFWRFPRTFTPAASSGIAPRSNYLKVIGDFCRWNDHIIMGCDDTAKSEFLNKRKIKGHVAAPQSQSNLWFVKPEEIDQLGPPIGRGAVWQKETISANQPSDPYLFSGYELRGLHLHHQARESITFTLEVDRQGNGTWTRSRSITVPAGGYRFISFENKEQGTWIRLRPDLGAPEVTAAFTYRNRDSRALEAESIFDGLARENDLTGGLVRALDQNQRSLAFAAFDSSGNDIGYYEMDDALRLQRIMGASKLKLAKQGSAMPAEGLAMDAASVIYTDENGKRWRLPKGSLASPHPLGLARIAREVATERDLLNAHGTFYELPSRNAGGIAKLRAVATHNRHIHDFCSYRGLFVMSGISADASENNPHIIRSDDGKTALWAGAIDDIWKIGKPRGTGGPWLETQVRAGTPSDPYLLTGFDKKILQLRSSKNSHVSAEIDLTGTGNWVPYKIFELEENHLTGHEFPDSFSAYWIRFVSDKDAMVTSQLHYR